MWLLRLYPRPWRRRYGEEFAALIRDQPWSFTLIVDVIAGAIDARFDPQSASVAPTRTEADKGDEKMIARMMKFRCAGYGPAVTKRDQWTSMAIMLGGTVVLTLIWMRMHAVYGDNPYVDSFSLMPFLTAFLLSTPLTSLKGRSRASQAVFIGGSLLLLISGSLAVGFITARM